MSALDLWIAETLTANVMPWCFLTRLNWRLPLQPQSEHQWLQLCGNEHLLPQGNLKGLNTLTSETQSSPPGHKQQCHPAPPTVWSIELYVYFHSTTFLVEFYVHLSSWGVVSALTFGCQLHNLVKRADLETRRAAWHLLVPQRLTAGWESARFDLLWSALAAFLDQ